MTMLLSEFLSLVFPNFNAIIWPNHNLWFCRKNDAIFGHDMIDDGDGFLSPTTDVIDSTAKSIPMPVSILVLIVMCIRVVYLRLPASS